MPTERRRTARAVVTFLKRTGRVLLTLVGAIVLLVSAAAIIDGFTDTHWALGLAFTVFYAFGIYLGIVELRSPAAQRFPVQTGLLASLLVLTTGIAVAASMSLQLQRLGWAVYEPVSTEGDAYVNLLGYYTWVFLDMMPAIDATELLASQR
jgi:hypothetical protein